jgi:hypothetical protein
MELMNQVRGYKYLLGVLKSQQKDPYCNACSAFANTLKAARENFARLEAEHADALKALEPGFGMMLVETREGLSTLQGPADPSGQKKAGNCKLPQGMCFIKASFAFVQQI